VLGGRTGAASTLSSDIETSASTIWVTAWRMVFPGARRAAPPRALELAPLVVAELAA